MELSGVMWLVLILSLIVCAYMAWNIGANDVANAMGTSVGSKALTLKQAVIIAAVFEFCGAFFAGDAVTDTVRKGILVVDFETVTNDFANDLMYGFIAAIPNAYSDALRCGRAPSNRGARQEKSASPDPRRGIHATFRDQLNEPDCFRCILNAGL